MHLERKKAISNYLRVNNSNSTGANESLSLLAAAASIQKTRSKNMYIIKQTLDCFSCVGINYKIIKCDCMYIFYSIYLHAFGWSLRRPCCRNWTQQSRNSSMVLFDQNCLEFLLKHLSSSSSIVAGSV